MKLNKTCEQAIEISLMPQMKDKTIYLVCWEYQGELNGVTYTTNFDLAKRELGQAETGCEIREVVDGEISENILNIYPLFESSLTTSGDRYVWHSSLGEVVITDQCRELQKLNLDPSTLFVEYEGQIREVTKSLVREIL